jgi:hypothetical protein
MPVGSTGERRRGVVGQKGKAGAHAAHGHNCAGAANTAAQQRRARGAARGGARRGGARRLQPRRGAPRAGASLRGFRRWVGVALLGWPRTPGRAPVQAGSARVCVRMNTGPADARSRTRARASAPLAGRPPRPWRRAPAGASGRRHGAGSAGRAERSRECWVFLLVMVGRAPGGAGSSGPRRAPARARARAGPAARPMRPRPRARLRVSRAP